MSSMDQLLSSPHSVHNIPSPAAHPDPQHVPSVIPEDATGSNEQQKLQYAIAQVCILVCYCATNHACELLFDCLFLSRYACFLLQSAQLVHANCVAVALLTKDMMNSVSMMHRHVTGMPLQLDAQMFIWVAHMPSMHGLTSGLWWRPHHPPK